MSLLIIEELFVDPIFVMFGLAAKGQWFDGPSGSWIVSFFESAQVDFTSVANISICSEAKRPEYSMTGVAQI